MLNRLEKLFGREGNENEDRTDPKQEKPDYTGSAAAGIDHDTGMVMTEEEMAEERARRLEGSRD